MSNKTFGNMVKKLRTDKNLTMEELGEAIGVKKSRINMWENNGVVPRDDVLIKLSKFFEVSTDALLGTGNEGVNPNTSPTLNYLHRNLNELNEDQLQKAKKILSDVFDDIFNDEEE